MKIIKKATGKKMSDSDAQLAEEYRSRIRRALKMAPYGMEDGAMHKEWVIDQMVRALTGDGYDDWVAKTRDGEDGPHTYDWSEGVAP